MIKYRIIPYELLYLNESIYVRFMLDLVVRVELYLLSCD
jgi:hypothetical protein